MSTLAFKSGMNEPSVRNSTVGLSPIERDVFEFITDMYVT